MYGTWNLNSNLSDTIFSGGMSKYKVTFLPFQPNSDGILEALSRPTRKMKLLKKVSPLKPEIFHIIRGGSDSAKTGARAKNKQNATIREIMIFLLITSRYTTHQKI
jgi:hypothetical protein